MRLTLLAGVLVLMAAAGGVIGWQAARVAGVSLHAPAMPRPVYRHHSQALKLEQVRKLGELVTLDVPVSDVQTSTLEGFTGSVSLVMLVHGSVQVSTDLELAQLTVTDAAQRHAVLTLPAPRTARPRLDHDRTQVYRNDRTGLWRLFPTPGAEAAVYDRAMQQAQRLIESAADQPDLIDQARRRTADVLAPFFAALDWQVELRWSDQPAAAPLAAH